MRIQPFTAGPYGTCCYIVYEYEGNNAVLIDAPYPLTKPLSFVKENGLRLEAVYLTHGHFDHISGADDIRKEYPDTPHCVHSLDYDFFQDPNLNVSAYLGSVLRCQSPEEKFNDGDTFKLKDIEFKVIHTPGHTRGGVCFYTEGHLFCGDTLFAHGIGRTDLATGDYNELENSIKEKIFKLDDDTLLYPGHEAYGFKLSQRKKMGVF